MRGMREQDFVVDSNSASNDDLDAEISNALDPMNDRIVPDDDDISIELKSRGENDENDSEENNKEHEEEYDNAESNENDHQNIDSTIPIHTELSSDAKSEEIPIKLGGSNCTDGKPAYAVLTGIWRNTDPEERAHNDEEQIVTIPITRIPIILGRKWGSKDKDPHHVALPRDEKLLSRLHCCIFYRDANGGRLGFYDINDNGTEQECRPESMSYKPHDYSLDCDEEKDSFNPDNILRTPEMCQSDPLPKSGFFAIECLGRKSIRVGGRKLTKGKQAMLQHGITIQMASYCLYFLLPNNTPSISQSIQYQVKSTHTMTKIDPEKIDVAKRCDVKKEVELELINEETKSLIIKKEALKRGRDDDESDHNDILSSPSTKKSRKSEDSLTSRIDNLTTETLLEQLTKAAESKDWTREDQHISATLGIRIARAAAKDKTIQKVARNEHGITQREIMDWVNNHNLFHDYERSMLLKIERKSFLSSVSKAIHRAGYTRNESNPGKSRCIRWDLPSDIPLEPLSPSRSPFKSPHQSSDNHNIKGSPADPDENYQQVDNIGDFYSGKETLDV